MAVTGSSELWRSDASLHLATGAYVDDEFRRDALNGVYYAPERVTAPSYGFDAAFVLFHCAQAWRWQLIRDVLVVVALFASFVISASIASIVVLFAVLAYLVTDVGRVVRIALRLLQSGEITFHQFVVRYLRAWGRASRLAFGYFVVVVVLWSLVTIPEIVTALQAGSQSVDDDSTASVVQPALAALALLVLLVVPTVTIAYRLYAQRAIDGIAAGDLTWRRNLDERLRTIGAEQSSPVVRYSGFEPFIGAGRMVRDWSVAHRLMPVPTGAHSAPVSPAGPAPTGRHNGNGRWRSESVEAFATPFDAVELVDHLRARFDALTRPERDATQRLDSAAVSEHVYLNGRYPYPFAAARPTRAERDAVLRTPDGPARHHLVCQASAWGGEIIVTMYVLVSVQAGMLHVEFTAYALGPTKPGYHQIHERGGIGPAARSRAVWAAVLELPGVFLRAPIRLLTMAGDRILRRSPGAPSEFEQRVGVDCGAAVSVRELGTSDLQNFYQFSDTERFLKLVERRLLADITEFLDDAGVDVSDFGERVGAILNNTLIHNNNNYGAQTYGAGNISISESVLGQGNTTTKGASL